MISCDSFRKTFAVATEDAELLAHLRICDRCLDHAAGIDPDVLFRALGGDTLVPPGGIDAFVGEVMQQVRVRDTETTLSSHRELSWPRRLAIAATVAAGISGAWLVSRDSVVAPVAPIAIQEARAIAPVPAQKLTTRPTVESYESSEATIIEVPSEGADDAVKIVMIFDENLPADL
jgi:hypothetical protein